MSKRNPTAFLSEEYRQLVKEALNWRLWLLQGPSTPRCIVDGRKVIMLCSNNYLNLSNHPRLIEAAIAAIKSHGVGSGSVRAIAGNMDLHVELEKRLAAFKEVEASLVYSTGFAVNTGLIPALIGDGDAVVSDELNHGAIIDGIRLTKAKRYVYKHIDIHDLELVIKKADKENPRRILVVTDGVFSMDGDICPLRDIVNIAEPYGALIYVDDAHGEGVLGKGGRGIVNHFGLQQRVHVEMGTFSKALGCFGGHVNGSKALIDFALNKSRTWLLSASHPPSLAAACIAAIDVLETEPQHVQNLWKNTDYFRKAIQDLGFNTGNSQTPIIPVIVGKSASAKKMSQFLYEKGVFALPIVYPMVARDKARIRTIMNAALTKNDLIEAIEAFKAAGKILNII
ncbi:MAG: glycine C-acetyltransferase [Candidatus Ranarchaeia archaeon]